MTESFKDKLRSLSFPRKLGQKEKVPVINEDTGRVGGYYTKHWDGKQDVNVTPESVAVTAKTQEELEA